MMRREAAWLGQLLSEIPADELDPVLSVGSGTADFRRRFQPWIDAEVYEPLTARGVRVLHHELEPAEGIDVAGDLAEETTRESLREFGVQTILCLNVFEHVVERPSLADALMAALPVGGRLIVTVPHRFPYHADPIDTLYRPDAAALRDLFPADAVVSSGNVRCESLVSHWMSKPGKLGALRKLVRPGSRARPTAALVPTAGDRPGLLDLFQMALGSTEVTYVVVQSAG